MTLAAIAVIAVTVTVTFAGALLYGAYQLTTSDL